MTAASLPGSDEITLGPDEVVVHPEEVLVTPDLVVIDPDESVRVVVEESVIDPNG